MKFKVGDVVKVKSLDWYNENKNESGNVYFDENTFVAGMRKFCNKCATIVNLNFELYEIDIDDRAFNWTDEMFEDEPVQITPELSTGVNNLSEHQTYSSGMKREPQGLRERFDLITPECLPYNQTMLYRWAVLMAKGAEKYGEHNWEQATGEDELSRFKQSAFRHFMKWFGGEHDEDHASAVFFNISGAEMVKIKMNKE